MQVVVVDFNSACTFTHRAGHGLMIWTETEINSPEKETSIVHYQSGSISGNWCAVSTRNLQSKGYAKVTWLTEFMSQLYSR